MASDKVLKFQVAIQDNATKELDEIEKKFLGLSHQAVSVVGTINKELQKIGGVSFNMPDLSKMIGQLNNLHDVVSKKNTGDIPIFKNTLEQMQQLQNFIGKNTLGSELTKIKLSINSLFTEIPNVNANSFTSYFNQLSKAYNEFVSKIGNSSSRPAGLMDVGAQLQRMSTLSGNSSLLRDYQAAAQSIKATILNTIQEIFSSIQATKSLLSSNSLDFGKISGNIDKTTESLNKLAEAFRHFNGTIGGDKNLLNMMSGMGEIIRNVKFTMHQLEEGNKSLHLSKSMQDFAKSINDAQIQLVKLEELNNKLNRTAGRGLEKLGVNATDTIRQRQVEMGAIFSNLRQIINNGGTHPVSGLTTAQYMGSSDVQGTLIRAKREEADVRQRVEIVIKQEEQAERRNGAAKQQSVQATTQLTQEENKLAQAVQQSTNNMHGQSQILSDLKSTAFQYLSLYGMQNFVTNMAQITGELQLQAKSLEVILNNASAAKQMYGEIRDLSQMSPYTFEDLLKSHRQLAAFGIEPKDMFSTMKSLADIGAGLDVDISRLILAFGHTRSYGYLSGIQNRQFENAGIDMIGGLAAKYNELADAEKRAGREAQYVTRGDIFKRMRARSIPFEDVQDVVLDLDRPGGKFYNMQIRQFETLGGKLRNLRNNYRIMMSEIGNSNQGLLMGSVNIINDLTEHWDKYARVLKGVALAYGTLKLAGLASNKAVLAANREIAAMSVANNRAVGTTAYLNGTMGMWHAMGSSRTFGSIRNGLESVKNDDAVLNLAANEKINNLTKQRIALTGKLTQAQRELLLVESGIGEARAAQIAGFSAWKRGLLSVRLSMIAVAQSAKAMAVSLLTNPATWIFAAIAGITALADKLGQTAEQAENFKNSMKDAAQTDIQGLNQLLEPFENNGVLKVKGETSINSGGYVATRKLVDVDAVELEAHGIENVFDELKRALQVQSPFYDGDYFDIMKAKDQTEQVQEMFRKLENSNYVKQVEQMTADRMEAGLKETGAGYNPVTWGRGEGLGTNMKDYADAQAAYTNGVRITETVWNAFMEEDKKAIDNYVKELGISRDEAFGKYLLHNEGARNRLQAKLSVNNFERLAAVMGHLQTAKLDMKPVANTFASIFKDAFSGNTDGAMTYFEDSMNKMFAEAKIGSPEAQAELSSNMAIFIRDAMNEFGNKAGGEEFLLKYIERQIGVISNRLINKEVNINTKEEDVKKISEKSTMVAIETIKKADPKIAREMSKLGGTAMKALISEINKSNEGVANSLRRILSWQGRAKRFGIAVQPTIDIDYTEFIQEQRKKIKEMEDKIKANAKRIKAILGVDILPDFQFKNIEQVKAFLKLIQGQKKRLAGDIKKFTETHRDKDGITRGKDWETLTDMRGRYDSLKDYEEFGTTVLQKGGFLDNEHQSWHDDSKKKAKKGSQEDKYAKDIRSQAQLLGEAYNEYRKWEEKIGSGGALKKVQELFFGKNSALTKAGFSFKDVPNYYQNLEKLRNKLNAHYDTKKGHNNYVLDAIKELSKSMNQVNFDNFTKDSENWASKVSLLLDRLTKKWDLYNKVLQATGDKQLAMSLSGLNAEKYQNQANELKDIISRELKGYGVKNFLFDENASDDDIEKSVQKHLGENASAKHIAGIVNELKKWRDIQKQINDEAIETFANLRGGLVDFGTELNKINNEYDETLRKLNNGLSSGKISRSQYFEGENIARVKRDNKILENSAGYKNFFASVWGQSIKSATEMAKIIKDGLNEQFKHGIISAKDYTQKIKEVNDQMQKIETQKSNVRAFSEGGLQGLFQNKYDKAQGDFIKASNAYDNARSTKINTPSGMQIPDFKGMANASQGMNNAMGAMKGAQGAMSTVAVIDKIVNGINDAVQQLKGILDDLAQTLDNVGGKGDKIRNSGAYGFMGAFSQASQGAANGWNSLKNGDVMGAARGVIQSWTGWVNGFAQWHDSKLERQIRDLKEEVSKIEGYTETIAKAQGRTLGYDDGSLLRAYQQQYANNTYTREKARIDPVSGGINKYSVTENKDGAAGWAMANYYNSAGGQNIGGYEQQYNLLTKKRQNYVDIYNKEDEKKKKSESALEEYKQKIAELDDQLRYFSEDLAKRLWDIDVKGWADQLSDALSTAFDNGENMAKAYGDTVKSILQSIGNKMIQMQIMEPMFERLQTKLFGNGKDKKGVFDPKDVSGSAKKVTDVVADFFGQNGDGKNAILAAQEALAAYEKGLNDAGLSRRNESNSTLSSGIQGTSEETTALLAGYINALRQDVSVIRIMQTQFINEAWPDYIRQITGMSEALGRIDANVAAIRSIISENGALYAKIDSLADDLHGVVLGTKRLHVA